MKNIPDNQANLKLSNDNNPIKKMAEISFKMFLLINF